MFDRITNVIRTEFTTWGDQFLELLPNIILAIITILVFYAIAKLIKFSVRGATQRITKHKALVWFIPGIAYITTLVIGLFIALNILQLDKALTSLLAGVGIAGLGLSFAFKDVLSNFLAGIIMITQHPFHVGDLIKIQDQTGTVKRIYLRATTIRTLDGNIVTVPNQDFLQNAIINYTETGKRRVEFSAGISYGDDLDKAEKLARQTINKLPNVLKDEPIEFFYTELAGSSINLTIRFWIDFDTSYADYLQARSDAIRTLKKTYDKHGIIFPYPTTTLEFNPKGGRPLDEVFKKTRKKK